jgi:competence protein ComEA
MYIFRIPISCDKTTTPWRASLAEAAASIVYAGAIMALSIGWERILPPPPDGTCFVACPEQEVVVEVQAWWRSPRLCAAAACFVLGALLLAVGAATRLAPPAAPEAPALAELSSGLDDFEPEPVGEVPVADAAELVVYVSGAVLAPDVYRLPAGARVKDAVAAAGGLSGDAAGDRLNLAEPLSDAQHIHVPTYSVADAQQPATDEPSEAEALIDLNGASQAELEDLPGVGATLAGRILARREEQGPYGSVEDLREVSGIGEKLFTQIAPLVTVGP